MVKEVVSGIGKNAKRVDQNNSNLVSDRVKKLQNQAQMRYATGGTYGERADLNNLTQGASTEPNKPAIMATPARTIATPRGASMVDEVYSGPTPITDGAPGDTAGRQPYELPNPVDAPDNNSDIARAMFALDPTPQNRRFMESFQQAGR